MVENKNELKRFSYVLKDINSVDTLVKCELLADYENNDLIFIDENLNKHSIKEYIDKGLSDTLTSAHLKTTNQHKIATTTSDGFMSSEDKVKLEKLIKSIGNIEEFLQSNKLNSPIIINKLNYSILGSIINVDTNLSNGTIVDNINMNINCGSRPNKDFKSKYKDDLGIRDDLVYISANVEDSTYKLNIIKDVLYSEEYITCSSGIYEYIPERAVYSNIDNPMDIICPILLINRRNDEYINEYNINGKLSDNLLSNQEVIDVSSREINNIDLGLLIENTIDDISNGKTYGHNNVKIIKSNISFELPDNIISYVSFNDSDYDLNQNVSLNKNCLYKVSPFGKMMNTSESTGNLVKFNCNSKTFAVEFILDIKEMKSYIGQTIFSLQNKMIDKLLSLEYTGNNKFELNVKDNIIKLDLSELNVINDRYSLFSILVDENGAIIYVNGIRKGGFSTRLDLSTFYYYGIETTTFPIGEFVIYNTDEFKPNNIINDKTVLLEEFDIATKDDIFTHNNIRFTSKSYSDFEEPIITAFTSDGNKPISFTKDTIIKLKFSNDIVPIVNFKDNVLGIDGNKIYIKDVSQFNTDDIIIISSSNQDERYFFEITDIDEYYNTLTLSDIVSSDLLNYYIGDMKDSVAIKITDSKNEQLGSVGTINNEVRVIVSKNHLTGEVFDLEYICKNEQSDIIDIIDDVKNVKFGETIVEGSSEPCLLKSDISVFNATLNGKNNIGRLSQGYTSIVEKDNIITLTLEYNINRLFNKVDEKTIALLNRMLDISCGMKVYCGSQELVINDTLIENTDLLRSYNLKDMKIDADGIIRLEFIVNKINSEKSNKLILSDLDFNISFRKDFKKILYNKTLSNLIDNFLVVTKNGLFTNSKPTQISIYSKDDYYNIPDGNETYITERNSKGYRLVRTSLGLLKLLNEDLNKLYNLPYKYVVI